MAKEKEVKVMKVKCVRKGFSGRVRHPGEEFNFRGTDCPSWCVLLDGDKVVTDSVDLKATEAVAYLKTLKTADEVKAFTAKEKPEGETGHRTSVKAAALEQITILENVDD